MQFMPKETPTVRLGLLVFKNSTFKAPWEDRAARHGKTDVKEPRAGPRGLQRKCKLLPLSPAALGLGNLADLEKGMAAGSASVPHVWGSSWMPWVSDLICDCRGLMGGCCLDFSSLHLARHSSETECS